MRRKTLWAGMSGAVAIVAAALVGCAVGVRRDLSTIAPSDVIFDDQCHLQDYFDDLALGREKPPALLRSDEIQKVDNEKTLGGMSTYRFGENTSLPALRRLLAENWKPVPAEVLKTSEVDLEVRWCEKLGTRWVVNDENVEVRAAGKVVTLSSHPCLTSLLFGQPLFERRRELLGLPSLAPPPEAPPPDAGAPDLNTTD